MGKSQELLEAARNGNVTVVSKILEQCVRRTGPLSSFRRSPSLNRQDLNGYTPLHHACLNGHFEIVRLLLTHDVALDVPDIRGSTPLYLASWAGHHDIVKLLLKHPVRPANTNAQTIDNETPLHCAAQHGHAAVITLLLTHGADPTIRNNSFQTALDLACQFGRFEVVQILIRTHPELIEPFRLYRETSIDQGSVYTLAPTKHIYTHSCLHLAARNGHKRVVELLLEAGVDANVLTNSGTALHEAAFCGKKSVVDILLRAGVDPYAQNGQGRNVFDILKQYPPHVVYEIVSTINEFCQDNGKKASEGQFMHIEATKGEHDKANVNPIMTQNTVKSNIGPTKYSYTPMKPIKELPCSHHVVEYEPVAKYKSTHASNEAASIEVKEYSPFPSTEKETIKPSSYHCVDEYVEMREPSFAPVNSKETVTVDYVDETKQRANYDDFDTNNNLHAYHKQKEHSATPDFPPPTVSQAEHAIFELVKPSFNNKSLRRRAFEKENSNEREFYNELKTFIWENHQEPQEENTDSLNSSRISEYVEEFVSDVPFGGLFKGSSLNLVNDSKDENMPNGLRSPRLVRAVKNFSQEVSCKTFAAEQSIKANDYEFDASKVWHEIETIFATIGTEVKTKERNKMKNNNKASDDSNTLHKKTLTIRKPADLQLKFSTKKQQQQQQQQQQQCKFETENSKWCHSTNSLIYGSLMYQVYYLGSTVIRELHGMASTRKSIQRLKREELLLDTNEEDNLLQDINSSTRILKATNQQTRLEVGIAVSYKGVQFSDSDNKNVISFHNIENINCVCQDPDDLRYFAYITREGVIHYCHVFMVDSLDLATEIILTLAQAFEVAYQLSLIKLESNESNNYRDQHTTRISYIDIVDKV